MYRDWELIEVLGTQFAQTHYGSTGLDTALAAARVLIVRHDTDATLDQLNRQLRPLLAALPERSTLGGLFRGGWLGGLLYGRIRTGTWCQPQTLVIATRLRPSVMTW